MNDHKPTQPDSAQPPEDDGEDFTVRVANNRPAEVSPPVPGAPLDSAAAASGAPGAVSPESELSIALEGMLSTEAVQEGVVWLFDAAAARRGEHWSIKPYEAHEIAEPLALELRGLAEHAPFLSDAADAVGGNRLRLLIATNLAVMPRIATDRRLARQRRAEQLADRPQQGRAEASPSATRDASPEPTPIRPNINRPPVDFAETIARASGNTEG